MLSSEIARKLLTLYLIVVSFTAFLQRGADKKRATTGQRRIREMVLFFTAAIGGAAGACLGMLLFWHKTKHTAFVIGMPLLLLLWIGIAILLF